MKESDGLLCQQSSLITEESDGLFCQKFSLMGKIAEKAHHLSSQIFLLMLTAIISIEVVGRYVFNSGFTWSQELCELVFLLLVFLCQPDTWQKDRHIRMDVFYNSFSKPWKGVSNVLTILCGLILYGALAYQTLAEIGYQFAVGEGTSELMWPLWPFSICMCVSCLLAIGLLVRFAVSLISKNS